MEDQQDQAKKLRQQYSDEEFLGQGMYASVFQAKKNNLNVALRQQNRYFQAEYEQFQWLKQQKWQNCALPKEVFVYSRKLFTEFELFDGDCCQLKMKNNPQEWIEKFIIDVGNGLQQIHQDHYIHIDLKPANIVYKIQNNTYSFAICDFCSMVKVEYTKIKECLGTPLYMPYEMNDKKKIKENGLTTAVDVWAFGVTLFEFIASKDLLDEQTITKKGNQQFIDQQIQTVQDLFYQDLLKKLLQVDPLKRCTIKEFLEYFNGQKFLGNTISQTIIGNNLHSINLKTLKEFFSQHEYDYYMNEEASPYDFFHLQKCWTEESHYPN